MHLLFEKADKALNCMERYLDRDRNTICLFGRLFNACKVFIQISFGFRIVSFWTKQNGNDTSCCDALVRLRVYLVVCLFGFCVC